MQGFGILFGAIVALVVSAGFRDSYPAPSYKEDPAASLVPEADYVWRIILMFGTIPAALTYYWRMKMPETARYTALIARNAKQAAADMSKVLHTEIVEDKVGGNDWGLFSAQFLRRHGLHHQHVVPPRHRLLQPELIPEGHLLQGGVDPAAQYPERRGGGVPYRAGAGAHRALRHHPGLLVHRGLHRHRRPLCMPSS
jgi:hypothetical protein